MFNRATKAIMRAPDKIPGIDLNSEGIIQTACSCRWMQSHGILAADVMNKTLLNYFTLLKKHKIQYTITAYVFAWFNFKIFENSFYL